MSLRRAAVVSLLSAFVVLFAGGSVANSAPAKIYWGRGASAVLPANAAAGTSRAASVSWVSCPSAGNCGAVGGYIDSSGNQQGLLLTETAGKWAAGVEAVPPAGSTKVYWDGISCASAGNCTAIGSYYDDISKTGGPLVLTETAGVWGTGVQPALPTPEGGGFSTGSLVSVSCASAGNCTAVGHYGDGTGNIKGWLLTETDGVWATGVEAPLPDDAGTTGRWVDLNSVSCPSVGNCTAVGDYSDSAGDLQPLLLDETAGVWASGPKSELPANAAPTHEYTGFSVLIWSVSCASPGNCSAVGTYCAVGNCNSTSNASGSSTGEEGVLLTETDGTWARGIEATLPANAATTSPVEFLSAISCASAGNCSAVGDYYDGSLHDRLLLLTESAGTWSKGVQALLPANASVAGHASWHAYSVVLYSISCPAAGNCTAGGSYSVRAGGGRPLVLSETAGKWARGFGVVLPRNAAGLQDSGVTVSCASIKSCSAVGSYGTADGPRGLLVNGPSLISLVPDVEGKTLAAAKRSLRRHGCSVGRVTYIESHTVRSGHVISQAPKPGRAVKPGGKVNLVVSRG
jgi:PASTA domain-containing protein